MIETLVLIAIGSVFALLLARSAILLFWPGSAAAEFCEHKLGFVDSAGDSLCNGGSDGGGGDGGGD
jgi:hypothetical protein